MIPQGVKVKLHTLWDFWCKYVFQQEDVNRAYAQNKIIVECPFYATNCYRTRQTKKKVKKYG
jgi:hypothetical protein